jgi:hypothetical protein
MEAYNKALHSSQLYGPTNFAPCINHVSRQVFVISLCILSYLWYLSLPNNGWRLIVFALFLIIKSPKQLFLLRFLLLSLPNKVWGTYCFCSVSYYYFYYSYSFFPRSMNLSTADLRNYRTEFHKTWWSYRYMFLVDPKVFSFVVKGVKAIFLGVQRGWGLL